MKLTAFEAFTFFQIKQYVRCTDQHNTAQTWRKFSGINHHCGATYLAITFDRAGVHTLICQADTPAAPAQNLLTVVFDPVGGITVAKNINRGLNIRLGKCG